MIELTYKDARAYILKQLPNYLTDTGRSLRKNFTCPNPDHTDKNPSASYDKEHDIVKCFTCNQNFTTIDLIGIDYKITDNTEMFKKALEYYDLKVTNDSIQKNLQVNPENKYFTFISSCVETFNRVTHDKAPSDIVYRGITKQTLQKFNVGICRDFTIHKGTESEKKEDVYIIPNTNAAFLVRGKEIKERRGKNYPIFNQEVLYKESKEPVFIVEGEIDCLSLIDTGIDSIAIGGLSGKSKLMSLLKDKPTKRPLIIALDDDIAKYNENKERIPTESEKATLDLINDLKNLNLDLESRGKQSIPFYMYNIDYLDNIDLSKKDNFLTLGYMEMYSLLKDNVYKQYKDFNEMLQSTNRIDFQKHIQEIVENCKKYLEKQQNKYILDNSIISIAKNLLDNLKYGQDEKPISTGFNLLDSDNVFRGGLRNILYSIGGTSSTGKTAYIMQIADFIASNKKDVLVFAFEMSRAEIVARSVSRMTYQYILDNKIGKKYASGSIECQETYYYNKIDSKNREIIDKSYQRYMDEIAPYMFINERSGVIGTTYLRDTITKHIDTTGRVPVVFIDYFQLLQPDRNIVFVSDKQFFDMAISELKCISRDFNTPVINISSFNRASYDKGASQSSFKESGLIEYSSDCLLGLQYKGCNEKDFDLKGAQKKELRDLELCILKNRRGKLGMSIALDFTSEYYHFKEKSI